MLVAASVGGVRFHRHSKGYGCFNVLASLVLTYA